MSSPQETGGRPDRRAMPAMPSGVQTMPPVAQVPPDRPGGGWRGGPRPGPAADLPSVTIGTYNEYADAQRAVDHLSDQGFPVQYVAIVGTGLRLEERVTGRVTTGRAALTGAGAGAWLGLFVGLLFGLFAVGAWLGVVLTALVLGAVWGAILGGVGHAMTRGQRDFSSTSRLTAAQYALTVSEPYADQARRVLGGLAWNQAGSDQGGNPAGREQSGNPAETDQDGYSAGTDQGGYPTRPEQDWNQARSDRAWKQANIQR